MTEFDLEDVRSFAKRDYEGEPACLARDVLNLCDEVERLRIELAHTQAIADGRWADATKFYIKSMGEDRDGGFVIDMNAGIIPLIAEHLVQTFEASGGVNYLGIGFNHTEFGPFELTIQKRAGKTPAQVNTELRNEVARLRADLERIQGLAERYGPSWVVVNIKEALKVTP